MANVADAIEKRLRNRFIQMDRDRMAAQLHAERTVLSSLKFTDVEVKKYDDRIVGISLRFEAKLKALKK